MPSESPLRRQLLILTFLMIATFGFRFIPYFLSDGELSKNAVWNASPVWAMFLLASVCCSNLWLGTLIPLAGYILTDLLLIPVMLSKGYVTGTLTGRIAMYAIFLLLSQLGWLLRRLPKHLRFFDRAGAILGAGLLGSLLFYLITNFIIWFNSAPTSAHYYPPTLAGLLECYIKAYPFFHNQVMGDLVFICILFPAYALLERYSLSLPGQQKQLVTAKA